MTGIENRFAIGDICKVEYDTVSQVITYIPNPKDRTKKKTEYLLEFENEAIHMFQGILSISEYIYRFRTVRCIVMNINLYIQRTEPIQQSVAMVSSDSVREGRS